MKMSVEIKSWRDIHGWFDYADLYDEMLKTVSEPKIYVEVGCWLGRSTAYMASQIKERDLPVSFYAVDTWKGSRSGDLDDFIDQNYNGDMFPAFMCNMEALEVNKFVHPLPMKSLEAAEEFTNETVDFLFIDADHYYDSVKADIAAWLPKMRKGGTMAGHDIGWEGLENAVREAFPDRYRVVGGCWVVDAV